MKKMEVSFGGGFSSILWSPKSGRIFSYEGDRVELHRLYGGVQFYESRSGASGAGWLAKEDQVLLGGYRTECPSENWEGEEFSAEGMVFIPYKKGVGIVPHHPVIARNYDHRKVGFMLMYHNHHALPAREMRDMLRFEGESKQIDLPYFWYSHGDGTEGIKAGSFPIQFFNNEKRKGPDIRHFLPNFLTCAQKGAKDIIDNNQFEGDLIPRKTGIYHFPSEGKVLCSNKFGFFDTEEPENCLRIEEFIHPNGWVSAGENFLYRRKGDRVEMVFEVLRASLRSGRYYEADLDLPKYIDFEEEVCLLDFYAEELEHWRDHLSGEAEKKAVQEFLYAKNLGILSPEGCRRFMEGNPSMSLSVNDSLITGNCRVGTENFCKDFGLVGDISPDEISFSRLLGNEHIEQMLSKYEFRKIISAKSSGLLEAKETEEDDVDEYDI